MLQNNNLFSLEMKIRQLSRKNTIEELNRKATVLKEVNELFNSMKNKPNKKQNRKNILSIKTINPTINNHPASKFIRGSQLSERQFLKFVTALYKGLFSSVSNLKRPSNQQLAHRRVSLPQPETESQIKKKFLILDLDETLIHSFIKENLQIGQQEVDFEDHETEVSINVRPHCLQFLAEMSKYFQIYVFTAGEKDYVQCIVKLLNKRKHTILGILHRQHCMQTKNGSILKDLRIIKNRKLQDIVILDNQVQSFGLQLENGFPILQFTDQKDDVQLIGIQQILIELSEVDDVRHYLREKFWLRKILETPESEYVSLESDFQKVEVN